MRRSDREVTSRAGIAEIIAACDCCRVGFAAEDGVYIVPFFAISSKPTLEVPAFKAVGL